MKHLRKFNESNDYYTNVEYNEYSDIYSNYVQFEQKYIDIINSRLKSEYKIEILHRYLTEDIIIDGGQWRKYEICQCGDEWFYIKKEVQDIMSGPYNESYNYYKCDQFDGLIKFLKDYSIID